MTKFLTAGALLLALLATPACAVDNKIEINNYVFAPQQLVVPPGTTVTWTNQDEAPHTVASKDKSFRSAALDTGESFSYTFTTPGTYDYFCTLHPHMVGSVTVRSPAE